MSGFSEISFRSFLNFSNIFPKDHEHSNTLKYRQKNSALFLSILFETFIQPFFNFILSKNLRGLPAQYLPAFFCSIP